MAVKLSNLVYHAMLTLQETGQLLRYLLVTQSAVFSKNYWKIQNSLQYCIWLSIIGVISQFYKYRIIFRWTWLGKVELSIWTALGSSRYVYTLEFEKNSFFKLQSSFFCVIFLKDNRRNFEKSFGIKLWFVKFIHQEKNFFLGEFLQQNHTRQFL